MGYSRSDLRSIVSIFSGRGLSSVQGYFPGKFCFYRVNQKVFDSIMLMVLFTSKIPSQFQIKLSDLMCVSRCSSPRERVWHAAEAARYPTSDMKIWSAHGMQMRAPKTGLPLYLALTMHCWACWTLEITVCKVCSLMYRHMCQKVNNPIRKPSYPYVKSLFPLVFKFMLAHCSNVAVLKCKLVLGKCT